MSATVPVTQDFETSVAFVLRVEGGFSNDAVDKGGPTNMGVTQSVYSAWLLNHSLPDAAVNTITQEYAEAIYREVFWNAGNCDSLVSPLNLIHFDSMVQHHPSTAKLMLSSALQFPTATVNQRCYGLLMMRDNLYRRIVILDKTGMQAKFLRGWQNRLENLREYAGL